MNSSKSILPRVLLASAGIVALSGSVARACSVCFGDPNSGLVKGAKAGVIVLAGIVYGVLFLMTAVAGTWIRRARRLAAADSNNDRPDGLFRP
ncbi:MAG: hypothetical protein HOP29_02960 [Phycisphaerales bacterium]|nr:hypothetical protein [Phycisphaerales bacterium]